MIRRFSEAFDTLPGVIFLPFAGAHRNSFSSLEKRLRERGVMAASLELPGHGSRFGEPLCSSIDEMVRDLSRPIASGWLQGSTEEIPKRLVLVGHSMGALLAWQLALGSVRTGGPVVALMLSGRRGPGAPARRPDLHRLPAPDFMRAVGDLGGCPDEVLRNDDLMALLEPILRSDLKAVETSDIRIEEPIPLPVHVIVGDRDTVLMEDAEKWSQITTNDFQLHVQAGGHFHLLEQSDDTVTRILSLLHFVGKRGNKLQPTNILHSDS